MSDVAHKLTGGLGGREVCEVTKTSFRDASGIVESDACNRISI